MKVRPTHTPRPNLPFETERLRAQDRRWIHSWENFQTAHTIERTIAAHAEGIYIYDTDGNRLIDGPGGMWCVNIGHGNGEIADAVAEQIQRLSYYTPWSLGNVPARLCAVLSTLNSSASRSDSVKSWRSMAALRRNCLIYGHAGERASRSHLGECRPGGPDVDSPPTCG